MSTSHLRLADIPHGMSLGEREIAELLGMDDSGELLKTLAGVYVADAATRRAQLASACEAGDLPRVVELAHLIRGSALTFGAAELVECSTDVEVAARSGHSPDDELMRRLQASAEQVEAALASLATP